MVDRNDPIFPPAEIRTKVLLHFSFISTFQSFGAGMVIVGFCCCSGSFPLAHKNNVRSRISKRSKNLDGTIKSYKQKRSDLNQRNIYIYIHLESDTKEGQDCRWSHT